jgi:hypothetical protein
MKESHLAFFKRGRDVAPEDDETDDPVIRPLEWTAEYVSARLIHACKVIEASVSIPRPARERTVWPQAIGGWRSLLDEDEQRFAIERERRLHARQKKRGALDLRGIDWRKYVPTDVVRAVEADAADAAARQPEQPSQLELAYADEAIHWPVQFLSDEPLWADALMVWAWTKATRRSLEKMLRARNRRAEDMIQFRVREETAARALRKQRLAAEVLAWGRGQIVGATSEDRAAILRAMQERLQSAIHAEGLNAPLPKLKPEDVAPGEVYTRKAIDTFRAKASARIARALHLERRPVR